jgi:hypothetical protein
MASWFVAVSFLAGTAVCRGDEAEDKAAAFVEKLGGRVKRDEKAPGKPVISVILIGKKVTNAELKELAPLQNLIGLSLSGTGVTDAGLKELAPLQNLSLLLLGWDRDLPMVTWFVWPNSRSVGAGTLVLRAERLGPCPARYS